MQGFAFIEFLSEDDAEYAVKIMNMIKMYGKVIRVNKAAADKKQFDIGANLFIGNLDPEVDEKLLYDTFSAFGVIVQTPKVMRDPATGNSKGFGFVNYDSFEASDAAKEAMHGQFLYNRAITVQYAYKKDVKGERHGTAAERLLAAQNKTVRPHQRFADKAAPAAGAAGAAAPPGVPNGGVAMPPAGAPAGVPPPGAAAAAAGTVAGVPGQPMPMIHPSRQLPGMAPPQVLAPPPGMSGPAGFAGQFARPPMAPQGFMPAPGFGMPPGMPPRFMPPGMAQPWGVRPPGVQPPPGMMQPPPGMMQPPPGAPGQAPPMVQPPPRT